MRMIDLLGYGAPRTYPALHSRYPLALGIEVELEDVQGDDLHYVPGWDVHNDMSLRDGMEFVFAGPAQGDTVSTRITTLTSRLESFVANPRTSTHVHVDLSWSTTEHLRTLFFFMYAFDEILFELFDPGRKWCGYCCSLAEMEPDKLRSIITSLTGPSHASLLPVLQRQRNSDRYYGFNIQALIRHGTVEFRHFPGGILGEQLERVAELVSNIVHNTSSVSIEDLSEAVATAEGTERLLRSVLGTSFSDEVVRYYTLFRDTLSEGLALLPADDTVPSRDNSLVFYNPLVVKWYQRVRGIPDSNMEQFASTFKLWACATFTELDSLAVTLGGRDEGVRGRPTIPSPFPEFASLSTAEEYNSPYDDPYDEAEDEDEEFN